MNWFPKQTIVVPIDFSDESFAALDTAIGLASQTSGVHVVYVLSELSPVEPGEIWRTVNPESRQRHATQAIRERLADEKYADVHVEVRIGDAGREIVDYADHVKADLIVMPSHGRSGIARLLIGSVAERTLRLAKCPVLVLRGPEK